jgi:hypothetical protein
MPLLLSLRKQKKSTAGKSAHTHTQEYGILCDNNKDGNNNNETQALSHRDK